MAKQEPLILVSSNPNKGIEAERILGVPVLRVSLALPEIQAASVEGEKVVATGTLSLKELRREKAYVAIDCDFMRGEERVWWARMTCIWPEVHLRGEV